MSKCLIFFCCCFRITITKQRCLLLRRIMLWKLGNKGLELPDGQIIFFYMDFVLLSLICLNLKKKVSGRIFSNEYTKTHVSSYKLLQSVQNENRQTNPTKYKKQTKKKLPNWQHLQRLGSTQHQPSRGLLNCC